MRVFLFATVFLVSFCLFESSILSRIRRIVQRKRKVNVPTYDKPAPRPTKSPLQQEWVDYYFNYLEWCRDKFLVPVAVGMTEFTVEGLHNVMTMLQSAVPLIASEYLNPESNKAESVGDIKPNPSISPLLVPSMKLHTSATSVSVSTPASASAPLSSSSPSSSTFLYAALVNFLAGDDSSSARSMRRRWGRLSEDQADGTATAEIGWMDGKGAQGVPKAPTSETYGYSIDQVRDKVKDFDWLTDEYITMQFAAFGHSRINEVDLLFLFVWGHVRYLCLLCVQAVELLLQYTWGIIKPVYFALIWVVFLWSFFISGIITAFIVVALPHFSDQPLKYIGYLENVEEILGSQGIMGSVASWVSDTFSVDLSKELWRLVTKILGPIPGFFSFINQLKKDTYTYCLGMTPTIFDNVIRTFTENPMFKDFRLFFCEAIAINFFVKSFNAAMLLFFFGIHMNTVYVLFSFIFTTWVAAIVIAPVYLGTPSYNERDVKLIKWKTISIYCFFMIMACLWWLLDIVGSVNRFLSIFLPNMETDTRFRIVISIFAVPVVLRIVNGYVKEVSGAVTGTVRGRMRRVMAREQRMNWWIKGTVFAMLMIFLLQAIVPQITGGGMDVKGLINVVTSAFIAVIPIFFFTSRTGADMKAIREIDTFDEYTTYVLNFAEQKLHHIPASIIMDFSTRLALYQFASYVIHELNSTLLQWHLVRWLLSYFDFPVGTRLEDIIQRLAYYFGALGAAFHSNNKDIRDNAAVLFVNDVCVYMLLVLSCVVYKLASNRIIASEERWRNLRRASMASPRSPTRSPRRSSSRRLGLSGRRMSGRGSSLSGYRSGNRARRLTIAMAVKMGQSEESYLGLVIFVFRGLWDSGLLPRDYMDAGVQMVLWWAQRVILGEYGYIAVILFMAVRRLLVVLFVSAVSLYYLVDKKLTANELEVKKVHDIGEQFGSQFSKFSYSYLLKSAHGHQQNPLFKHLLLFSDESASGGKRDDWVLQGKKFLKLLPLLLQEMVPCFPRGNLLCGLLEVPEEQHDHFKLKAAQSETQKLHSEFMTRVYLIGLPALISVGHFTVREHPVALGVFLVVVLVVGVVVLILFMRRDTLSIEDERQPLLLVTMCACFFPHEAWDLVRGCAGDAYTCCFPAPSPHEEEPYRNYGKVRDMLGKDDVEKESHQEDSGSDDEDDMFGSIFFLDYFDVN